MMRTGFKFIVVGFIIAMLSAALPDFQGPLMITGVGIAVFGQVICIIAFFMPRSKRPVKVKKGSGKL